jgi:hypothetical protein
MLSDHHRKLGLQGLIILACIFFFFVVISGVVRWLLPVGERNSPIASNPDTINQKIKEGGIQAEEEDFSLKAGDFVPRAAVLSYLKNDVRSKRANEIIWESATLDMPLYERDAVQTLKQSAAVITFDEKNFLDVSQNSLVIIKNIKESQIRKEKQSFLVLTEGDLRGQLEENKKTDVRLLVNTPTATTEVSTDKQSGKKSLFEITVKPDRTSRIKVLRGSAKVRAHGKEVEVKAHQMTEVAVNRPPKDPAMLPKAVSLQRPPGGSNFSYASDPPKIKFTWTPETSAVKYHLEIAEDPLFRSVVFEKYLSSHTFLYGNLKKGQYYWRVRAVDHHGEEGEPSETRQIEVVQDTKSPIHVW